MAALLDQLDDNPVVARPRTGEGGDGSDGLHGLLPQCRSVDTNETSYSKVAEDGRGGLECTEVETQCLFGTRAGRIKSTTCNYVPPPAPPKPPAPRALTPTHSPPLIKGSVGSTVKELQILLNRQMNPSPNLRVDGFLGDDTLKAVKRFNHEHKIRPEEVVSKQTWDARGAPEDQALSSNQPYQLPFLGEFSWEPKASENWLPPDFDPQKLKALWADLYADGELRRFQRYTRWWLQPASFAEMDGADKAGYVMNQTFESLGPELASQGYDLWEHKAEIATIILLGIAAHSNPVSAVIFDTLMLGDMAVSIGQDLGEALERIAHARSKRDLREGARLLARVLAAVAIQLVFHFAAKGVRNAPKLLAAMKSVSAARRAEAAAAARSSAALAWFAADSAAENALKTDPGKTKPSTKELVREREAAKQEFNKADREYEKAEAEHEAADAEAHRQAEQLLKEPADVTDHLEQAAADAGMKAEHLESMRDYCRQHQRLRIMRFSNPASVKYYNQPGYVPKGVDVKLNTAKTGPNAGLVVRPENPTAEQLENIKELTKPKKGYKFDDQGRLRDPKGNLIHADYDTQGEYEVIGTDRGGKPIYRQVDTQEPYWRNRSNDRITPERRMTQHGAQDNYVVPDENGRLAMGRFSGADEKFLAVGPDGSVMRIENPESLREFIYEQNNIPYIYAEQPAVAKDLPVPTVIAVPPGKDKKDEPAAK